MTVTLTASYKEMLSADTVEKIDELIEENYALDDMLEFIDNYNERMFVDNYEEYVRCGEAIGYEAVDAYANENGIDNIDGCDERYRGCFDSEADFAEDFYNETMDVPAGLVIDWQATYDQNLRYDFTSCDDGTSYRSVHIFSDY
jgi:antirestriction protein